MIRHRHVFIVVSLSHEWTKWTEWTEWTQSTLPLPPIFSVRFDVQYSKFSSPILCPLFSPHPFIPVSVIPSMNDRWAKKNSTMIGSITTSDAAIIRFHAVP